MAERLGAERRQHRARPAAIGEAARNLRRARDADAVEHRQQPRAAQLRVLARRIERLVGLAAQPDRNLEMARALVLQPRSARAASTRPAVIASVSAARRACTAGEDEIAGAARARRARGAELFRGPRFSRWRRRPWNAADASPRPWRSPRRRQFPGDGPRAAHRLGGGAQRLERDLDGRLGGLGAARRRGRAVRCRRLGRVHLFGEAFDEALDQFDVGLPGR